MQNVKTMKKYGLSFRAQTLAALGAIVAAVALPQIFHAIGAAVGSGTALGETFLPMHLPIIAVGLLAGPYAGLIAGLLGPAASFVLSGMPGAVMLPFMMLELGGYGVISGLLCSAKIPTAAKILAAQVGGRVIRAVAVLFAVYALGSSTVAVASIWNGVINGLPGLVIQWTLLPLMVLLTERLKKTDGRA